MIPVNGSYIQMSVRDIMRGRKHKAGYLVELIDRTSEQNYLNAIENYNSNLQKEVARKTADIVHIKDMMVLGMATMVESRDNSTGGHIRRTSRVVEIFQTDCLVVWTSLEYQKNFFRWSLKRHQCMTLEKLQFRILCYRNRANLQQKNMRL